MDDVCLRDDGRSEDIGTYPYDPLFYLSGFLGDPNYRSVVIHTDQENPSSSVGKGGYITGDLCGELALEFNRRIFTICDQFISIPLGSCSSLTGRQGSTC